jgi:hypothetical protein
VRHVHVEEDQIWLMFFEIRERLSGVRAMNKRMLMRLKIDVEQLSVAHIIID